MAVYPLIGASRGSSILCQVSEQAVVAHVQPSLSYHMQQQSEPSPLTQALAGGGPCAQGITSSLEIALGRVASRAGHSHVITCDEKNEPSGEAL